MKASGAFWRGRGWMVLAILAVAVALRLYGITYGLPALYDPDEPIFILTGLRLLKNQTLNPGWFGHPGSTTIYTLAIIELAVLGIGLLSGRFADVQAFGHAVYTTPGVVFLPGRLFIFACSIACVALTFVIARRLFGERVALLSAALLAINPLHIKFAQIIRTDVHATVFMLLCVCCAIDIVRRGRLRDYVLAAICCGLAIATKWPAGTVLSCMAGACVLRIVEHRGERAAQARNMGVAFLVTIAAVFVASPYIFLDYRTVLTNLTGEAQILHLGATGGGFGFNLAWYLAHPIPDSIGWLGLAGLVIGLAVAGLRSREALVTLILPFLCFGIAICTQGLIWARWVVPLLPFVAILVAVALCWIVDQTRQRFGRTPALAIGATALLALAVPMLLTARADATERLHDTRRIASSFARAHIPPGSSVAIEHFAFDLLDQPWSLRFPAGAQCIDAVAFLHGQVPYSTVGRWRGNRAILDLGTVDPTKLDTCRADYAILVDYDRYIAEGDKFPEEIAVYRDLTRGGVIMATIRPVPGKIGGPIVRIVKLPPRLDTAAAVDKTRAPQP